eukprot:5291719-Heterocapsa_arctica.AAC.1
MIVPHQVGEVAVSTLSRFIANAFFKSTRSTRSDRRSHITNFFGTQRLFTVQLRAVDHLAENVNHVERHSPSGRSAGYGAISHLAATGQSEAIDVVVLLVA